MTWHRHVWKVVRKDVSDTPWEAFLGSGMAADSLETRSKVWFERDVIVTRRCERCGTEEVVRL